MPTFKNKPRLIEAEQFWPTSSPLPFHQKGPFVMFDGERFHVTTAHGQKAFLEPGDWVIPEPSGPGVIAYAAYPVKPDIFADRYVDAAADDWLQLAIVRIAQRGRDRCGAGFGKYPLGVMDALKELVPFMVKSEKVDAAMAAFEKRLEE